MKIFDCHLHVNSGLLAYDLEVLNANIILNTVEEYRNIESSYLQYKKSLIFDYRDNLDFVISEAKSHQISAFKIHSRIQKIGENDYEELIEKLKIDKTNLPVIYDAFYFGTEIEYQPSLKGLIQLIKEFPSRRFIIAHCGGYNVLKYFFHLREFDNVYWDLSFSLQYLEDSSTFIDLVKLIKYSSMKKLLFGSDYPYASASKQLEIFKLIAKNNNIIKQDIENVVYNNAQIIFK